MADHPRIRQFLVEWTLFIDHSIRHSVFNLQQVQPTATTTCFLTIFSFAFTVILNFLQLKYEGQNQKDPFQTHPTTMRLAVTSLLTYCFLCGIHQRFSSPFIARAMVFFALLSLLSTASILFPESVRGVFYALCILLSAGDFLHLFIQKIKNRFRQIQVNYNNIVMRMIGFPSVEHRLRLPI
nr:hypothetical protein A4A49_63750 [Ipomoea batatas]GMD29422.1 hypothetical protein A4A49_63750 [Ipomoea batatas]GMD46383.1 hypothetical protein A4A49_63750 [Ipomoea batatas]GME11724.1 hypothetical protein A4A49_63750 [Ipomoea batatas]